MRIAGVELRDARPVAGGDICTAYRAVLDDGTAVFAKTHRAPPDGFFTAEAAGLAALRDVDGPTGARGVGGRRRRPGPVLGRARGADCGCRSSIRRCTRPDACRLAALL